MAEVAYIIQRRAERALKEADGPDRKKIIELIVALAKRVDDLEREIRSLWHAK